MVNDDDLNEVRRILDRHIPDGQSDMKCHSGICSQDECGRCKDAAFIRGVISKIVLYGHRGEWE